jgi:S-adenosylmethionine decarboxylase
MLDAYGVDSEKLDDMKLVFKFLNDLPGVFGMEILTWPIFYYTDEKATPKDPGGISGFVIIAESHIAIHTFAKRGFFTMDVYSCRAFEEQLPTLIDYIRSVFPYQQEETHIVQRGTMYPLTDQ